MAKRDNKTEHVMKLITKDGAMPGASSEGGAGGIGSVEASVPNPEGNPLNYKTKLKIEIEPELEVREPVRIRQPRSRSVSFAHGDAAEEEYDPREDADRDAPLAVATEASRHGGSPESLPDGTPYGSDSKSAAASFSDGRGKGIAAAPRERQTEGSAAASAARTVYDEVRALRKSDMDILKQAEKRREKKIQIENSLMVKSKNLINLSEVLTKELLPSVMEQMDVCTCPVCTGNVLALALNALPTKYVTTDEGKQYTQLEVYKRQNELDVVAALTRACVRVKESPRHEIIDDLDE
ncbi:MAG: late competence development ComFB family protein [Clostridiales Family XIII bacterium]|jgi:competence protein ComFB|nr:late competence development ComFB family protein [Clostridiales Family XIII bacterium]